MNQQAFNPADASPVEPTAAMTGVEMKGFFIASAVRHYLNSEPWVNRC